MGELAFFEIARAFSVPGGATAVARWTTRKYKKYVAYLGWRHRQELIAAGIDPDKRDDEDEEDDGTPKWEVSSDEGGDWESESHSRPR